MATDWITPVGSGVVAVAGLVFGWEVDARERLMAAMATDLDVRESA